MIRRELIIFVLIIIVWCVIHGSCYMEPFSLKSNSGWNRQKDTVAIICNHKVKSHFDSRLRDSKDKESILIGDSDGRSISPSVIELLRFGLPTLGIWLLQPILSLIDSSVVGISAKAGSITELAALGPGIMWCDGSMYLCQFVGMATTNLYATALGENDENKAFRVLSEAISIACIMGASLGIFQYTLAAPALRSLSGVSADEVVPYALQYVRARSFGAPAALLTIVGQSAFLASKDAVTPLKAVVFGTLINLFGDILLVIGLKQGIVGAAVATMLSQVGGGLYLLAVVISKLRANSMPVKRNGDDDGLRKRPSLYDMLRIVPPPTPRRILKFMTFAGPLFMILLSKQVLWTFASLCASSVGTAGLAAHQVNRIPSHPIPPIPPIPFPPFPPSHSPIPYNLIL